MNSFIKSTFSFIIFLFSAVSCCLHADTHKIDSSAVFFFTGNTLGYVNNIEYFNKYRDGILHCGGLGNFRLGYSPSKQLKFSIGIHLRKAYGDENFFSNAIPIFNFRYNHGNYFLNIGELNSKNRHNLIDAIIKEQYQYDPAIEEGFQTGFRGDIIKTDFWLSSHLLNTARQREHLSVGNFSSISAGGFSLALMAYWDHYGGQLFNLPDDPIRDNITGSGGILYSRKINTLINKTGIEIYGLGSLTTDDRKNDPFHKGYGVISKIWLEISRYKASILFYKGEGYQTWKGNRIYQTNKYYYFLQIQRKIEFNNNSFLDFGIKFDFVDITPKDYFNHTEHQIWIRMGNDWKRPVKIGKNK